jgi:hypothetical protein
MAKYQRTRKKANRCQRVMKVILTLHKSVNKIDKQSSNIKQLCWENTATKMRTFNQIWKTKSVYSKEEGRKESC